MPAPSLFHPSGDIGFLLLRHRNIFTRQSVEKATDRFPENALLGHGHLNVHRCIHDLGLQPWWSRSLFRFVCI